MTTAEYQQYADILAKSVEKTAEFRKNINANETFDIKDLDLLMGGFFTGLRLGFIDNGAVFEREDADQIRYLFQQSDIFKSFGIDGAIAGFA